MEVGLLFKIQPFMASRVHTYSSQGRGLRCRQAQFGTLRVMANELPLVAARALMLEQRDGQAVRSEPLIWPPT